MSNIANGRKATNFKMSVLYVICNTLHLILTKLGQVDQYLEHYSDTNSDGHFLT